MRHGSPTSIAEALFQALDERSLSYLVIRGHERGPRSVGTELRVLIAPEDLDRAADIARSLHLTPEDGRQDGGHAWSTNGNGEARKRLSVRFTTTLHYGDGIRTAEPDRLVLGRRRRNDGLAVAATSDELIDLMLHCVLEARDFQPEHRARVAALMSDLRAHPPDAGRAAIRVQTELAPALSWSDLLDDVVHERWDDLLARRGTIVRRLRRRWPDAVVGRLVRLLPRRSERSNGEGGADVAARREARGEAPRFVTEPPADAEEGKRPPKRASADVTRKQIRGSGLLLAGYGFSAGVKFAAELIIVRYLATSQYGAWTYALAAIALLRGFAALGLSRAVTKFLPQHLEERELTQFYGVLFFVLGSVAIAGALVVTSFYTFPEEIATLAGAGAGGSLAILLVLIFRVPLEVLDNVLLGVSAAFGDSRTIFVRRFLLHPLLRLGLAVLVVALAADVVFLAWGYLIAAISGVTYYAWSVVQQMQERGLLRRSLLRGLRLPVRRVLSYTAPVMASDWCSTFMITAGPLLLGYFTDLSTVALYQVVVPVAALNTVVFQSFSMLYEPSASRLVTRKDVAGLNGHYWRSALWVAVLTFPLFALSFTAAVPLTVTLFGERYAAAAPILSVLALGRFVDSMAGFNAATLRVSGQLRQLIRANVIGALVTVALTVVLIPSMGAVGAAMGAVVGLTAFTLLKQMALRATAGVTAFDVTHAGPYLTIAVTTAGLVVVRLLWADVLWIVLPAVAVASLAVLISARVSLSVSDTFPELARWRVLRTILG
jgi:O-antigen/teichoic acid export membrane protein